MKSMLVVLIIIISTQILDTSLNRINTFIINLYSSFWNLCIFIILIFAFLVAQYFILKYVLPEVKGIRIGGKIRSTSMHFSVMIAQFVLATILLLVILQIVMNSQYDTRLIISSAAVSYFISIFMMSILTQRFLAWFFHNRKPVVLFYGIATASICVNAALTFTIMDLLLIGQPFNAEQTVQGVAPFLPNEVNFLYDAFTASSILSFTLTWIATAFLFYHYSQKLAGVRFWILISLPLVYYALQFMPSFLNLLYSYKFTDPVTFGILYTIVFAASKTAGGILFAAAFWSLAKKMRDRRLKKYMIISAIGLALVFSSDQAIILSGRPYPPFGLYTICFLGLASYLALVGIYYAAISAAQDSNLRLLIRDSVRRQSNLLDFISSAQMEVQIRNTILEILNKTSLEMNSDTGVQSSLSDQEIRLYIDEALTEVKKARGMKSDK